MKSFRPLFPATTWHCSAATIVVLACWTGHAWAQTQPDDLRAGEALQDRFDRRQSDLGIYWGGVLLKPYLTAGFGFDNNIYAQSSGDKADAFALYGGGFSASFRDGTFSARMISDYTDHKYLTYSSEDYWNGDVRLYLDDELSRDLAVFAEGGVRRLTVPRTDPNGIDGLTPAHFTLYDVLAGTRIGNFRNLFTVNAGISQSVYDPVQGLEGPIDTHERNLQEITATLRYDHGFFGQQDFFADVQPNSRTYGKEIDNSGFRRASTGVRGEAGFTFDFNSIVTLTASAGYQAQDYADPRYGDINEPDAAITLVWMPTLLTQVSGKYIHEYSEDLDFESPGFVHDEGILEVDHELRRNILLTVQASYDARDLQRSTRIYDITTVEMGVQYQLADGLTVSPSLAYATQDTDTPKTYNDTSFTLSLKKKF